MDCRGLRKGDAYGWLLKLSKLNSNPIVIINNITQVPDGDRNIYDDPEYIRNILLRSWKNEQINVGDAHIDRKNITVIITSPNENSEILHKECVLNTYKWLGYFDVWVENMKTVAEKYATSEFEKLKHILHHH